MWFTDVGNTGTLTVEPRDDGWYVASPGDAGETKCLLKADFDLDESKGEQEIEVSVIGFRWGVGTSYNRLSVSSSDGTSQGNSTTTEKSRTKNQRSGSDAGSSSELWELKDFNGSGEYVTVEATIDAVFFVKKAQPGMPDVKGELTDDSLLQPVSFVVNDGVNHPYLGEGNRYRFENMKDHFYKKQAEVQVVISKNTSFVELD